MRRVRFVALMAVAALALASCGSDGTPGATPTTPSDQRPSSTAQLSIVSPKPGDTIRGSTVKLRLTLTGARIVPETTKELKPDEGHLHVLLDGRLISQTAGLETAFDEVPPGQHTIRVEFVAGDHAPFFPRVFEETLFQVTA